MHRRPIRASALLPTFAVLATFATPLSVRAQPPTPPADGKTLASLEWLAGTWQGSIGEDRVEESWLLPVGGAMAGIFRWSKEGEVYLYELLTLEASDDGVTLKLKHFGPGLVGWEDKAASVVFDLAESAGGRAVFEQRSGDGSRVTYRRSGEGAMTATFQERGGPELVFEYTRR
jgi:hypothetical protein